jgi:hypothetical protein
MAKSEGGETDMPDVNKCQCEECHYNEAKRCRADAIEVNSSGDMKVETADGTRCDTFKKKA